MTTKAEILEIGLANFEEFKKEHTLEDLIRLYGDSQIALTKIKANYGNGEITDNVFSAPNHNPFELEYIFSYDDGINIKDFLKHFYDTYDSYYCAVDIYEVIQETIFEEIEQRIKALKQKF